MADPGLVEDLDHSCQRHLADPQDAWHRVRTVHDGGRRAAVRGPAIKDEVQDLPELCIDLLCVTRLR